MPGGDAVASLLDEHTAAVLDRDPGVLTDLVAGCVAIKAAVVAADPEERTGVAGGPELRPHPRPHARDHRPLRAAHGEAVAVGLVFAVHLARNLERIDDATVEHVTKPPRRPRAAHPRPRRPRADELLAVMRRDKKVRDDLTFVLPGPHGLELVHDPTRPRRSPALPCRRRGRLTAGGHHPRPVRSRT